LRLSRLATPFLYSRRRRHTSSTRDWSSDVCSSDRAASKTAIRGLIPRGCAMWEMPKRSRRLSATQFLPGSSPGSHSIGGREATEIGRASCRERVDGGGVWLPYIGERSSYGIDASHT